MTKQPLSLGINASDPQLVDQVSSSQFNRTEAAQEVIYDYFLEIIANSPTEQVVVAFKKLFLHFSEFGNNLAALRALEKLVIFKQKSAFKKTLNRCCYILINNLDKSHKYIYIRELVDSLARSQRSASSSYITQYLSEWISAFTQTSDYQKLKSLTTKRSQRSNTHWSQRYVSYLLISQSSNSKYSTEQQEATKILSEDLKKQFKYDLAQYTASLGRNNLSKVSQNPLDGFVNLTIKEVNLLKKLIAKRGFFDYTNIANIFLRQVKDTSIRSFKAALVRYLLFAIDDLKLAYHLKTEVQTCLTEVLSHQETAKLNKTLLLEICQKLLQHFTTEGKKHPSKAFTFFMVWGDTYTYALFLVKIILICPESRSFLDCQIGNLINYYQSYPEEECRWIVSFFSILTIAITVQVDKDVRYSLVKINPTSSVDSETANTTEKTENYRIFSQAYSQTSQSLLKVEL